MIRSERRLFSRLVLAIALLCYCKLPANNVLAQEHGSGNASTSEAQDLAADDSADSESTDESPGGKSGTKHARSKPFQGFSKFKSEFGLWCEGLEQDGRRELVLDLVKADGGLDLNCSACRPLFAMIENSCRPRTPKREKKKKPKKEEPIAEEPVADTPEAEAGSDAVAETTEAESVEATPTATPTPSGPFKQREPSLLVVHNISEIFIGMNKTPELTETTYPAVQRLLSVLRAAKNLTPAERDYLDLMIECIVSPYRPFEAEKEARIQADKKKIEESKRKIVVDELFDF